MNVYLSAIVILALLPGCYYGRVIDLTYPVDSDSWRWGLNTQFNLTILNRGIDEANGLWLENNDFFMNEHTGTHIDAPVHIGIKGQWRIDDIPIDRLTGPGVVIDVKKKANQNPDYAVTVEDLVAWESQHGRIPDGSIILMNSGWTEKYLTRNRAIIAGLTGNDITNTSDYHFPAWSGDAIQWLITNRDFTAVGGDTPSTDIGQESVNFPVHELLSINQKIGLEGVGYLDNMPPRGTRVYIGVMKLRDGSGAPARIFAVPDEFDSGSGSVVTSPMMLVHILICSLVLLFTSSLIL